jgi:hypothetical protein
MGASRIAGNRMTDAAIAIADCLHTAHSKQDGDIWFLSVALSHHKDVMITSNIGGHVRDVRRPFAFR